METYRRGDKVSFLSGAFKGKKGTVQIVGETGRILVKMGGTTTGPNGEKTKLGSTFASPEEIRKI